MKYALTFTTILLLFISKAYADEPDNIHKVCNSQAALCYQLIPYELDNARPNSNIWYKLKMYQLDNLFALQKTEELQVVLENLPPLNSTPVVFQITAYFHLVKLQVYLEQFDEAENSLLVAVKLITEVTDSYPDPIKLVNLANLQMYNAMLKENKNDLAARDKALIRTLNILTKLQNTFHNSYDAIFNRELYGNLGQVYNRLGKKAESFTAFQTSLFWAKQGVDLQQLAVAHYNLARSYQNLGKFKLAIEKFKTAQNTATLAGDDVIVQLCDMQIASINVASEQTDSTLILPTDPE